MAPQPLDEVRAADDDARLRPAEQLVAREADEVGAGGEARGGRRLALELDERARAEVVDERQPGTSRHLRRAPRAEGCSVKPDLTEVRLMDAQDERRLRPDRALVVGRARPVRRPHLAQPRARAREHVGDPEAVADLDQLAARDEHLATLGERGEREQHRRRVVVDDERRLGAGEAPQERSEVVLPRAARAGGQVVLEVRVAAADLEHARESRLRERRPAEVRVERGRRVAFSTRRSRGPRRAASSARASARPDPRDRRRRGSPRARARGPNARRRATSGRDSSASRSSRRSSSTEGRSRRRIEHECNGRLAATLSGMRRVAFRLGWVTAALVVAAAAVVLVRDAVYSKKPLPGVEVRAVDLDRPLAVTVENRRYVVRGSRGARRSTRKPRRPRSSPPVEARS